MMVFKCKMCGANLEVGEKASIATCDYCETTQTIPRVNDEKIANLYNRANHFRRRNEFDKAMDIYEQILSEDSNDSEAYWSLVLCRYGIEYVEDPATKKRVPTVNRTQFTSIFSDADYKLALQYADNQQKVIYETEAKTIDNIQKRILAISSEETPFDVFICYKETDPNGQRTPDSVLANDLYDHLTKEGFKVFFSRITLEDKLGSAYEPYIFAALNSAKVMVAIGTKPEFFNAVWVKNEWGRFLSLIKNGSEKTLIPAFRDMDPYDLPEEFSHLQAQDMSKLGFMQDLVRGIKKILGVNEPKITIVPEQASTATLLKRVFMFLDDGDWQSANDYCEKVLDIDPENASAYLGKLMASVKVRRKESLQNCTESFAGNIYYIKVARFGDAGLKQELQNYIKTIETRVEAQRVATVYEDACTLMAHNQPEMYLRAAELFYSISNYKDASSKYAECKEKAEITRKDFIYNEARKLMLQRDIPSFTVAMEKLQTIPQWRDSSTLISHCKSGIDQINYKIQQDQLKAQQREAAERATQARIEALRKTKVAIALSLLALLEIIVVILLLSTNNISEALNESFGTYALLQIGILVHSFIGCILCRIANITWPSYISSSISAIVAIWSNIICIAAQNGVFITIFAIFFFGAIGGTLAVLSFSIRSWIND